MDGHKDFQHGSFLGPAYSSDQIREFLDTNRVPYQQVAYNEIPQKIANLIAGEKVVGWFQGLMEFGPRALGARSIVGDAHLLRCNR